MALTKCKECGHEVSTKAEACPSCGAKIAKKGMGCGTLLLVLFIVGVVAAVISPSDRTPSSSSEPRTKSPREEALETVSIKNFSWRKGGFENVMMLTATIENKGKRSVKDIEITCTHSAKSGTVIDKNRKTVYETVPAGGSKTIRDFSMGFIHSQAARSSCEITELVVL